MTSPPGLTLHCQRGCALRPHRKFARRPVRLVSGHGPTMLERSFVTFQRPYTRGRLEGTGLALPICRTIVGGHGGRAAHFTPPAGGGA